MKSAREKIVKATALLMGLQIVAQITGLLKQVLIAAQFGTSDTMDGYLVAVSISALILIWLRLPIRQTLLPMFRHDLSKRGEPIAWANFSVLFNNLLIISIAIAVGGWLLAPYLVSLIAPGFGEESQALATSLTQIVMANVVFMGMAGVLSSIFLSYERFFVPGVSDSVNNLVVMLVFLVLGGTYGIYGLTTAVVIASFSTLALYFSILWEKRKFYTRKVDLRHPGMFEMGRLSFPLLISTGGTELAQVTDRIFASLLSAGSLSSLAFGRRPINILLEFFLRPIQKSTFPHFTKLSAEEKFQSLSRQLFLYLRVVFFLAVPVALCLMVISEPLVRMIYQRGAFDETSTRLTSQALFFYAIGFPALTMSRILNRTFFGLKDTWTPTKVALLRTGVKIILSWILIHPLAHRGIALAESISQVMASVFLFFLLPEEVKGREVWNTAKSFGLTLGGSALMVLVVYLVKERINGFFSAPWELVSLGFLGMATYGFITFLFRREELRTLLGTLVYLKPKYLTHKL